MNASPPVKLLLVDDEPGGRLTLETALAPLGFRCLTASSGREALASAEEHDPDLVLLDVMMPEMDGFEVCRRLRARPRHAEVPILLVTALDDRESRLRGIDAGADDFLSKPIDRVELRTRVRSVARLNRYRRLLAERSRFEWLAERSPDGYVLVDHAGCIRNINPSARQLLHLDEGHGEDFLAAARRLYRPEPFEAWADWPLPWAGQRCLVRPDTPSERHLWLAVSALPSPPALGDGTALHLRDVTRAVDQQQDLWRVRSVLSHKLRTPLTTLTSGLDLLTFPALELSPQEIEDLLAGARSGAVRLRGAIEDLLRYVDAPRLGAAGGAFPLGELPALVGALAPAFGVASVDVRVDPVVAAGCLPLARTAVEPILVELLGNAQRFHPRRSPAVRVAATAASAGRVALRVQDDGVSLSPERLSQIGTPFFQGEKFFTGEMPGMGLGLATIRSIVWEAGGSCRAGNVDPGPGVGIDIELPLLPAAD